MGEGDLGVAGEGWLEEVGGEVLGGVEGHAGAEKGEAFGGEGKADGVGVAAETGEEVWTISVDGGEGFEEVEAADGAAGAVGGAFLVGEDEGGAAGAVDDAGGEDAEDATVPVGVIEDDAVGGLGVEGGEVLVDGGEGVGFGGAAVLVEAVELFGEELGVGWVAGEKELDDVGGDVHAAGGVDAGGYAEADFGGGWRAVEGELGDLHEGAEAGLAGVGEFAKAEKGDGAVLAGEGDGVGDGGDGGELEEGGEGFGVEALAGFGGFGVGLEEGLRELEGDGGSAEVLVGVGAVGLGWVEDGEGFGEAFVGKVVVGDDEVEREDFGFGGGGEGADAGVDGDDEADAGGGGETEDVGLHAVAFADSVGDVVGDLRGTIGWGDALDGGLEEDGGDGAVDVVVAVDEDGLGGCDGVLDAGDGGGHAEKEKGVVEIVEGRGEEGAQITDGAGGEDVGDGLRTAQGGDDVGRCPRVRGRDEPLTFRGGILREV